MRNHASAAHPNQAEITGLDLSNWAEVCIREVITTPPDTIAADTKRLLAAIRRETLTKTDAMRTAAFFENLPRERATTLARGLFGLYVDRDSAPSTSDNVRLLWPELWQHIDEETRHSFGIRHATAGAAGNTALVARARELLDLVDGTPYLHESIRTAELAECITELESTHNAMNNFANEPPVARRLAKLVGSQGNIPRALREQYLTVICRAYLGNPYGVSWAAADVYSQLLGEIDTESASFALRIFMDQNTASRLAHAGPQEQWQKLLAILEPKLVSDSDRTLLATVRGFSQTPDRLRLDSEIKRLVGKQSS